ncbi:MAG TPA: bifunctional hydroxymethylpyrimidine kinase/phosphomethylpyrimidine kinase [Acidobacteriaceae bacterium]|nr:bifunctional hydroxymethylpyrimidine kinase/phosphomethylpyrimidine kinase [Acidobacteriaceae bacterium]
MSPPSQSSPHPTCSTPGAQPSITPSTRNRRTIQSAPPIVLSIAGYDPSAGAGVLADLKTFAALGVYGMASITALTIQSTLGVRKVIGLDPGTVTETLECLAGDVCFDAIKVGMLGTGAVAAAVTAWLEGQKNVPVVLDPVIKSSAGKDLLDSEGRQVLQRAGLARANWVTPNLHELAVLTGESIPSNSEETEKLARKLYGLATACGNPALKIVVTGGHAKTPDDLLLVNGKLQWFPGEWVRTKSTHGTGCTFSSALAAFIGLGDDPSNAVSNAKCYVTGALQQAYPAGTGRGSINHSWIKV